VFAKHTTNHKNAKLYGHSHYSHTAILTDYWNTNCVGTNHKGTLCPCKTANELKDGSACKNKFINGVHWMDLVKEGVVQSYDESKLNSEQIGAECIEEKQLTNCDGDSSGSFIQRKNTPACSQKAIHDTSLHMYARFMGQSVDSSSKMMKFGCEAAKGEKPTSKSVHTVGSKCSNGDTNTVDFIVTAQAIASWIHGTQETSTRKFHVYAEFLHVHYYTSGCDGILADDSATGRRLLSTGGQASSGNRHLLQNAVAIPDTSFFIVDKELSPNVPLFDVAVLMKEKLPTPETYASATALLTAAQIANGGLRIDLASASADATAAKADAAAAKAQLAEKNALLASATADVAAHKGQLDAKNIEITQTNNNHSDHQDRMWAVIVGLSIVLGILAIWGLVKMYMRTAEHATVVQGISVTPGGGQKVEYRPLFRQQMDL